MKKMKSVPTFSVFIRWQSIKKSKKQEQSQKEQEEQNKEDARKQNIMSDYEEEKWLKELENQKTNSLLKKMESSNEDSISNPW